MPFERKSVLRPEAAQLIDSLLTRVARGRGALQVSIGEGLAALAEGDRLLRLGYSGIGDYARERLGMAGRTAQEAARLARELRTRPLLRAAVRRGEVSARKARTVLPLARGEADEHWVARARAETVRALEVAVRVAAPAAEKVDEEWERMCVPLSPEARAKLDQAIRSRGSSSGRRRRHGSGSRRFARSTSERTRWRRGARRAAGCCTGRQRNGWNRPRRRWRRRHSAGPFSSRWIPSQRLTGPPAGGVGSCRRGHAASGRRARR